MRNQLFFFILMIAAVGLTSVAAQEQPVAPPAARTISGGVLNGKATNLVKPAYPAAARAVNAEGAVNVQVTIDEEGNVISAAAVSGHPLLRAASVEAARASKFSPTQLSGQLVKVTGVIVYNFVAGTTPVNSASGAGASLADTQVKMQARTGNWFQAGQTLAALDGISTLRFFQPGALNYIIPADWTSEREQIKRLEELKKTEMETATGEEPKERVIDERTISDANKNPVRTQTRTVTASPDRKASSEVSAISQSLVSSIQGRLAANEMDLWHFNLGIQINKAMHDADSPSSEKRIDGVRSFREFIKNTPASVPAEIAAELEKIATMAEKGIFTDQDKIAFTQAVMRLNVIPRN